MTRGITYFCTDQHGNVYRRFSVQHARPQYVFAVISRYGTDEPLKPVGKSGVSYSRGRSAVEGVARRAVLCGGTALVVDVRPYSGNLKTEPAEVLP